MKKEKCVRLEKEQMFGPDKVWFAVITACGFALYSEGEIYVMKSGNGQGGESYGHNMLSTLASLALADFNFSVL